MPPEEADKIIDEIYKLSLRVEKVITKQSENHKNNKEDIDILFNKLSRFDTLPCDTHIEKFKKFDDHVNDSNWWRGSVAMVVIAVIGFAVAWGVIKTTVDTHTKQLEKCCGDTL